MNKKDCKKCKYHAVNRDLGGIYCNYMMIKKRMRKSDPGDCKEFEKGKMMREKVF